MGSPSAAGVPCCTVTLRSTRTVNSLSARPRARHASLRSRAQGPLSLEGFDARGAGRGRVPIERCALQKADDAEPVAADAEGPLVQGEAFPPLPPSTGPHDSNTTSERAPMTPSPLTQLLTFDC